ncbi:cAMP receptor protein [mine drainage metagenome]|uniref:cAMP receptor protein n=1 Tax=mine drainage metagenome TaxID=410659 RepID=A0A1J5RPD6_9ZZZZ
MAQIERFWANCPLFADADAAELADLTRQSAPIHLQPRQSLFLRGEPGDHVYLLVSGAVRITVLSEDGREVMFALIEPGQVFGEISVLDEGPRTANATAMGKSELLALSRGALYAYLDRKPERYRRLIAVLCQRIRSADQLLEDLLFQSTRTRLAKHLRDLAGKVGERDGPSITLRMSQQDLADNLGVSRELVNKILSRWESAGTVSLWRGKITFLLDALPEGDGEG